MSAVFDYAPGNTPLLISIPHDGRDIPPQIASRLSEAGRAIPDTDWHVGRLYAFTRDLGAGVLAAKLSRYVIDLNRPASDEALYPGQLSTGLCPTESFAGESLYRNNALPDQQERHARIERYWRPYHDQLEKALAETKARFGYALLWDAHSIPGEVPLLFNGSLPDLNIGSNGRASCAEELEVVVFRVAESSAYSAVLNGRFKGGYITRHYGNPDDDVHAVQLELAQRCYMDEKTLAYDEAAAAKLGHTIRQMLQAFMMSARNVYA